MTYDETSPILGTGTLTPDDVMDYRASSGIVDPSVVLHYLTELHRLCDITGINFDIAAAQWGLETDWGRSERWRVNRNPAGLGIESDNDADPATLTPTEAARLHLFCLWIALTTGLDDWPGPAYFPEALPFSTIEFENRWIDKTTDGQYPRPVSVADLQKRYIDDTGEPQAVWAWDDRYAAKLVERANALLTAAQKGAPMTTPPIYDLMRDYARYGISQEDAATIRGYRFENRQGQKPQFIVLHVQAGTTHSSLDWWANGYVNGQKVTASSTVMIQRDGSILQVIPEQHAPWTNGDDRNPTLAGSRLVNLPGNSNLYTLSIEAEGMTSAEVANNPVQLDAIAWQVAKWQSEWDIPDANVIRHADINTVDRPGCGTYRPEVMKRLPAQQPKPTPEPFPIWWDADDVGPQRRASDGAVAIAFRGEVRVKGDRPINLRQGADPKAPVLRKMQPGEKGIIRGTFVSANKQRWAFVEVEGKVYRTLLRYFDPATWPTL